MKKAPLKPRRSTTRPSIRRTKGICGGDPRIAGTRIPVWGLVIARRLGIPDQEIGRRYRLTMSQLKAAWSYAARHEEEIEEQIQKNQDC